MESAKESSLTNTTDHKGDIFPELDKDSEIECLARVSLSDYGSLSRVNKLCLSAVRSPGLYATRSKIGATEYLLAIRLHFLNHKRNCFTYQWGVFNPTNTTTTTTTLTPIKPCPAHIRGASFVYRGYKLFVIGGENASHDVWIYDFVSGRWAEGPKMLVGRASAAVGAVDDKIFVIGGCTTSGDELDSEWVEVLDISLAPASWEKLLCLSTAQNMSMHSATVVGKKIYAFANKGGGMVLDTESRVCELLPMNVRGKTSGQPALVNGVFYSIGACHDIIGFDLQENVAKILGGMKDKMPRCLGMPSLANVGERLFMVWEESNEERRSKYGVFCGEIVVHKDEFGDFHGSLVDTHLILEHPTLSTIDNCLVVRL